MIKLEIIKLEMVNIPDGCRVNYEGFTLQNGFLFGRNLRGQAIASSGWVYDGANALYLYTRTENGWKACWEDLDKFDLPEAFVSKLYAEEEKEEEED